MLWPPLAVTIINNKFRKHPDQIHLNSFLNCLILDSPFLVSALESSTSRFMLRDNFVSYLCYGKCQNECKWKNEYACKRSPRFMNCISYIRICVHASEIWIRPCICLRFEFTSMQMAKRVCKHSLTFMNCIS